MCLPMRRRQRVGQGDRDVEELRHRDGRWEISLVERAALDQFHRHEADAAGLLDGKDRHDVRMIERREQLGFALKSCEAIGILRKRRAAGP